MQIVRIALLLSVVITLLLPASANNSTGVLIKVSTLPIPIVAVSSSSSSNSNSGNSGIASDEPISNIARSDRKEHDLRAGHMATYLFNNLSVYKVEVMPYNSEFDIIMKVEELINRSNNTKNSYRGAGEVYKYFNLYVGSKRIDNATIYFTTPASNSAELLQWNMTTWQWDGRETLKIDDTNYRANIIGFSNFAIVLQNNTQPIIVSTPPIINVTATPELPHTDITNEEIASPETIPSSDEIPWYWYVIGLIVLFIILELVF